MFHCFEVARLEEVLLGTYHPVLLFPGMLLFLHHQYLYERPIAHSRSYKIKPNSNSASLLWRISSVLVWIVFCDLHPHADPLWNLSDMLDRLELLQRHRKLYSKLCVCNSNIGNGIQTTFTFHVWSRGLCQRIHITRNWISLVWIHYLVWKISLQRWGLQHHVLYCP